MSNAMRKPDLTEVQWNQVIACLLENASYEGGVALPVYGAFSRVAKKFGVSSTTISNIWRRAVENRKDPAIGAYIAAPQKKGNCGRKPFVADKAELIKAIKAIPLHERRTIRSTALHLGMAKSTLQRIIQNGDVG